MVVLENTAVFVPAAAGSPTRVLTRPLIRPKPIRSQPVAAGAENELPTRLLPVDPNTPGGEGSNVNWLTRPLIGLFGGGGLVVPVVRTRLIGLPAEPIPPVDTRNGLISFTRIGSVTLTSLPANETAGWPTSCACASTLFAPNVIRLMRNSDRPVRPPGTFSGGAIRPPLLLYTNFAVSKAGPASPPTSVVVLLIGVLVLPIWMNPPFVSLRRQAWRSGTSGHPLNIS